MKKGEIWLVEFPFANGHEQSGTRPIIALTNVEANTLIVVPITSNMQALRFLNTIEIKPSKKNGLNEDSIALVFQIRAIDVKRLKIKKGELEEPILNEISLMLRRMFGL